MRVISFLILYFFNLTQTAYTAISFSATYNGAPVVKEDEMTINVAINGLTSCTKCYLQAAFSKDPEKPRYFGYTKNNNGGWYKYQGSANPDEIRNIFYSF